MARDVLMGNDRDCARWIRQFRVEPTDGDAAAGGSTATRPGGPAGRPDRGRAGGRPGLDVPAAMQRPRPPPTRPPRSPTTPRQRATAHVIFTPSGRRGRVRPGTTVLDAARSLGVDIDSVCGGRGICGRCQSCRRSARSQARDHSSAGHLSTPSAVEDGVSRGRGTRRRPAAVLHRVPRRATSSSTCRPRARSTARSCARTSRPAHSRSIPSCACTRSTSRSRTWPRRPATSDGCSMRSRGVGSQRPARRPRRRPRAPVDVDPGTLPGDRRRPRRPGRHRDLAGLP